MGTGWRISLLAARCSLPVLLLSLACWSLRPAVGTLSHCILASLAAFLSTLSCLSSFHQHGGLCSDVRQKGQHMRRHQEMKERSLQMWADEFLFSLLSCMPPAPPFAFRCILLIAATITALSICSPLLVSSRHWECYCALFPRRSPLLCEFIGFGTYYSACIENCRCRRLCEARSWLDQAQWCSH
jgi:hypothetical protein